MSEPLVDVESVSSSFTHEVLHKSHRIFGKGTERSAAFVVHKVRIKLLLQQGLRQLQATTLTSLVETVLPEVVCQAEVDVFGFEFGQDLLVQVTLGDLARIRGEEVAQILLVSVGCLVDSCIFLRSEEHTSELQSQSN